VYPYVHLFHHIIQISCFHWYSGNSVLNKGYGVATIPPYWLLLFIYVSYTIRHYIIPLSSHYCIPGKLHNSNLKLFLAFLLGSIETTDIYLFIYLFKAL